MASQVSYVAAPVQSNPATFGARGEVRSGAVWTVLSLFFPIAWMIWLYFKALPEMKAYLGKSDAEVSPTKDFVISLLTLGIAGFWHVAKLARLVHEAQVKQGRTDAQPKGTTWVVLTILFFPVVPLLGQNAMNELWTSGR